MREDKENLGKEPLVVQIIITHPYYFCNVFLGNFLGRSFFGIIIYLGFHCKIIYFLERFNHREVARWLTDYYFKYCYKYLLNTFSLIVL